MRSCELEAQNFYGLNSFLKNIRHVLGDFSTLRNSRFDEKINNSIKTDKRKQ